MICYSSVQNRRLSFLPNTEAKIEGKLGNTKERPLTCPPSHPVLHAFGLTFEKLQIFTYKRTEYYNVLLQQPAMQTK